MILTLKRSNHTAKATIGSLFIDGAFECFTLEDVVRPVKIAGETAIPAGRYEIIINFSNRFQRRMPLLLNVPNFDGVRIHTGNTDADTHGCILVGKHKAVNKITGSRSAYSALFKKLDKALKTEKAFLDIVDASPPAEEP